MDHSNNHYVIIRNFVWQQQLSSQPLNLSGEVATDLPYVNEI